MKYYRPMTKDELLDLTSGLTNLQFLSGGTDILPRWENPDQLPSHLIDLKNINTFCGISEDDTHVSIGALTTVETLRKSDVIHSHFQSIVDAASQFAGVQIRHRATVGGNICNASPAGDLIPCLLAHRAAVELIGSSGVRVVPLNIFFTGPGKTIMKEGEILTKIILKKTGEKSLFYKLGLRQSMAISVINFAIVYSLDSNGELKSLNIACGSCAPTVVYLNHFTKAILHKIPIDNAIDFVEKDIQPIDDIRASANYRRTALKNVLKYYMKRLS